MQFPRLALHICCSISGFIWSTQLTISFTSPDISATMKKTKIQTRPHGMQAIRGDSPHQSWIQTRSPLLRLQTNRRHIIHQTQAETAVLTTTKLETCTLQAWASTWELLFRCRLLSPTFIQRRTFRGSILRFLRPTTIKHPIFITLNNLTLQAHLFTKSQALMRWRRQPAVRQDTILKRRPI